ncbi:MAG: NAD-dependent malic enzyme [Gammaproteobacteria bacterium]|jgi:malate dehydrogenase (oxaloacetate-decarboxylating)
MNHIVETSLFGDDLLRSPVLNKGTAFTAEERETFNLLGKLPPKIETLTEQVTRAYQQFQNQPSELAKYTFLNDLHDRNETLFYKLVGDHLTEMMPIIYTPVVGEAVQEFSAEYRRPRGLFISYPDKDKIAQILANVSDDIDIVLVTDSEAILGLGDQGVGGINICIGKLAVYTLCAGLNPHKALPVVLDVGTNNQALLNDPCYLGWKHPRITGSEYDDFIDTFVRAVQKRFPNVFLHWEDFARDTARENLLRYRSKMCTFNDDMQGTGAVVLAALLTATKRLDQKLSEQKIVFFGAGTSATGIADQICDAMVREGISIQEARDKVYLLGRRGLITENLDNVTSFQKVYAKDLANMDLLEVVQKVKPTVLIGVSTVGGAFSEDIVKAMADNVTHPIIFPLSNPTAKSEAIPADIAQWTNGKALVATGSPFDGVSQCNNAFVFPGIGLGVIAVKARRLTSEMIWAGCCALTKCVPTTQDIAAPLLPGLEDIQAVSSKVAAAVAKQAIIDGVAPQIDIEQAVFDAIWRPKYVPYQLIKK